MLFRSCTKIFKIYPVIDANNRKLYAEAYGTDLLIGSFGDGYIEKVE